MTKLIRLTPLLILLGGCAGVTHTQVRYTPIPLDADEATIGRIDKENAARDAAETGIRYYDSSYYLLVYPDGAGGIQWQLLQLPDQTKLMSAQAYSHLARLKAPMSFHHGMLVKAAQASDTTDVAMSLVKAVGELLPSLVGLAGLDARAAGTDYTVGNVHLYKIVFRGPDLLFAGGPCDKAIQVTLNPERSANESSPAK